MSEPFIGQILWWAPNFAPKGWAFCHGQLLSIAQNSALFSILGTTYGGDGETTFGLPGLRGRVAIQQGLGPGLSPYKLGEPLGQENVTLNALTLATHTHVTDSPVLEVLATTGDANVADPIATDRLAAGKLPTGGINVDLYSTTAQNTTLDGLSVTGPPPTTANTGGNGSHANMQPWLGLNFIIALFGIFPSRN